MEDLFARVIIPSAAVLTAAVGGGITIYIYYKNSKLEKAKWLYSLFEKFFYEDKYDEIRQLLDYDRKDKIEELKTVIKSHSQEDLEEKLVDYLNFFEFISSLKKMNQLSLSEIQMMFDYYIRRLGDYDFLMEYLDEESFNGLKELVIEVRKIYYGR